jgi:hypothetical protein
LRAPGSRYLRLALTGAVWSTPAATPLLMKFWKPSAEMVMSYVPGSSVGKVKSPVSLVTVSRDWLVAVFTMRT